MDSWLKPQLFDIQYHAKNNDIKDKWNTIMMIVEYIQQIGQFKPKLSATAPELMWKYQTATDRLLQATHAQSQDRIMLWNLKCSGI